MKKFCVFLMLIIALCLPAMSMAEDTGSVCGKSYKFTISNVAYVMTFTQGPFGPDCSGNAVLTWDGKTSTWSFYTRNEYFVYVQGLGDFIYNGQTLTMLDSRNIILTEF